jgi:hypothetical protein
MLVLMYSTDGFAVCCYRYPVFAWSDAAATIYLIARVCAALIQERRLLIPVATREVIRRETVDWRHWTRRFWPLCWCRRRLKLVLGLYRYFSCTFHRERVPKHVHVLRDSPIIGVARLLFESGYYFVQHFQKCGDYSRVVTNREQCLIERIHYFWLDLKNECVKCSRT